MELSLNNGTSWSSTLPDLSGNKTVLVRVKAQGINPASPATTLNFTTNNTAPVANADSASVDAGSAVTIVVLANDTDVDNNTLSIGTFEQPASGGSVTKSGNSFVFTSDGTPGTYTFRYWVYDGQANSLTPATVTVTVNAVTPPGPTCDPNTDPNCVI